MKDLVSVIFPKSIKKLFWNSRFNKGYSKRAQRTVNIIEKLEGAGRTERGVGLISQALT